jgi:hypothetical protein
MQYAVMSIADMPRTAKGLRNMHSARMLEGILFSFPDFDGKSGTPRFKPDASDVLILPKGKIIDIFVVRTLQTKTL